GAWPASHSACSRTSSRWASGGTSGAVTLGTMGSRLPRPAGAGPAQSWVTRRVVRGAGRRAGRTRQGRRPGVRGGATTGRRQGLSSGRYAAGRRAGCEGLPGVGEVGVAEDELRHGAVGRGLEHGEALRGQKLHRLAVDGGGVELATVGTQ